MTNEWVIQVSPKDKAKWSHMSSGSVGQTFNFSDWHENMVPVTFEEAMKLALAQGYNGKLYDFQFYNTSTRESIPFDLFPEIRQFNGAL